MAEALCGNAVRSKRGFLALSWSIVNLVVFGAFFIALIVSLSSANYYKNQRNYYYGYQQEEGEDDEDEVALSVTSRAMAFAILWTVILAILIGIYGTIVLGFVNVNGRYYWCCSQTVHATTSMSLGAFIGSLLMFANLNLVCAVLFGEFKIRDYRERGEGEGEGEGGKEWEEAQSAAYERSSATFSILCIFLTVLYSLFSGLVFVYSNDLLRENQEDIREEALRPSEPEAPTGYIGSKFDVPVGTVSAESSRGFVLKGLK